MKVLPGTTIETGDLKHGDSRIIFDNIFAGGGLMLSQICNMTGLEAYTVQNWVKRKFVTSPKGRLYTQDQFARLITINMLKDSLQIDTIRRLLSYINGALDDDSDNIITDSELYHMFVSLLISLDGKYDGEKIEECAMKAAESYTESVKGAKRRLVKVLVIMAQTYYSCELRRSAVMLMNGLD